MNNYCEFDNLKNTNKKIIQVKKFKNNIILTRLNITTKNIEKKYNKQKGIYSTIIFKNTDFAFDYNFKNEINILIKELKFYLKVLKIDKIKNPKIFIVGLGNNSIQADSLGGEICTRIISTTNLIKSKIISKRYFSNVFSLSPSVSSINGIDTYIIIKSIVKELKPDLVILIDSLTCKNFEYLNKTIQISSSGFVPGREINNNLKQITINQKLLKTPVLTIGCPVVINSSNILNSNINEQFLTSKDTKQIIINFSKIISHSLNKVLHKKLTEKEILFLSKP